MLSNITGIIHLARRHRCGVYVLCRCMKVVYIGKSKAHLVQRALDHTYDKDFDEAYFIPCDECDVTAVELALIKHYEPEYNVDGIPGKKASSRRKKEREAKQPPKRKYNRASRKALSDLKKQAKLLENVKLVVNSR